MEKAKNEGNRSENLGFWLGFIFGLQSNLQRYLVLTLTSV